MVSGVKLEKPDWLRVTIPDIASCGQVREVVRSNRVRSVCDSSHCPNLGLCWSERTATFMVLGGRCSRHCGFCAVPCGGMEDVDDGEPERIATAVKELGLGYVVITSVSRDDLPDMGADHFARCVREVRSATGAGVELLLPDLQGDEGALQKVLASRPDVVGHNIETVERLQTSVRDRRASFARSVGLLRAVKDAEPPTLTKSSIMLGLGEREEEVRAALSALAGAGVDILTIGQYLRPGPAQLPVQRYVRPQEFESWREEALGMGFKAVMSGPFVRSSYRAREAFEQLRRRTNVDG